MIRFSLSEYPEIITLPGFAIVDGWPVAHRVNAWRSHYYFSAVDVSSGRDRYGTFIIHGRNMFSVKSMASGADVLRKSVFPNHSVQPWMAVDPIFFNGATLVSVVGTHKNLAIVQLENRRTMQGWGAVAWTKRGMVYDIEDRSEIHNGNFPNQQAGLWGLAMNCAYWMDGQFFVLTTLLHKNDGVDNGGLRLAKYNPELNTWSFWFGDHWETPVDNILKKIPPKIIDFGVYATVHYNTHLGRFVLVCMGDYQHPLGPTNYMYASKMEGKRWEALTSWKLVGELPVPRPANYPVIYNERGTDWRECGQSGWLFYTHPCGAFRHHSARDRTKPTTARWHRRKISFSY